MAYAIARILLPPLLLTCVCALQRRYGPEFGGLVAGLPLTSGPIVLFAALDHGPVFAGHMAAATLGGATAACLLCWSYAVTARRHGPVCSVLVACAVFLVAAGAQLGAAVGPLGTAVLAVTVLLAVVRWWPVPRTASRGGEGAGANLPARMGVVALYVLTVTVLAGRLGPHAVGVCSPFPILVVAQVVHTHRHRGPGAAVDFLRGVVRAEFGFLTWFAVLAVLLPTAGVAEAFAAAACCAGLVQWTAYAIRRTRSASLVRGQVRQASSGRIA
ncbi:hypothetical protein ABZ746_12690 [Streptomyces sp. NPDC020096]